MWIVIAGVKTYGGDIPDFSQMSKGFHIPEMKLPLRLVKYLLFVYISEIVNVTETVEQLWITLHTGRKSYSSCFGVQKYLEPNL